MFSAPTEFYRLDPLTGCNNYLSFIEALARLSISETRQPFSLLQADLNNWYALNQSRGRSYGDSVIRWMGIVLREESNTTAYRLGGDEFAVILTAETIPTHKELTDRIVARLAHEGEQLGISTPAARIALIHYDDDSRYSLNDMMFQLSETMFDLDANRDQILCVYSAKNLIRSRSADTTSHAESYTEKVLRQIANSAINDFFFMSKMLDNAQQLSFLDAISGLPNMRAALLKLEQEITARHPFAFLLMDGDNIRVYNNVSYVCGDDMIRKVSAVFSEKLRPGDFLARWRKGDEFIAILPSTSLEGGRIVGERFRLSIKETSLGWMFPISITTGVATYPENGGDVDTIVDAAEKALKRGKLSGKDQVVLAE